MPEELFKNNEDPLEKSNKAHCVNHAILFSLLIEKGVFTDKDVDSMRIKVTKEVDKLWEEKKKDEERELKEKFPALFGVYGNNRKEQ